MFNLHHQGCKAIQLKVNAHRAYRDGAPKYR